jgi:hypothetical protein
VKPVYFCPRCGRSFDGNPELVALCKFCNLPTEPRTQVTLREMRAEHIGLKTLFKTHIVGESTQLAFERKFTIKCSDCEELHEFDLFRKDQQTSLVEAITRTGSPVRSLLSTLPRKHEDHQHQWKIIKSVMGDYREIRVRDLTELEEAADKSQVTKDYKGFLLGGIPEEKRVLCDSEVFAHPRSGELTLLARQTYPLRYSLENFTLNETDVASLRELEELDYDSLLLTADRTVAPEIRGRAYFKLASLLTNTSVNWFKIQGNPEPMAGCLRSMAVGDGRTGKGSVVRWWRKLGLAEYGVGETATRTGLTYYIDVDSNIIVWGLLPAADMGTALIEAIHGISPDEIIHFREALAQQKLTVKRKVSGEAWCRARIVADANAFQDLDMYTFPVLALNSIPCFRYPLDLTRWDLFVPFDKADVKTNELLLGAPEEAGLELDVLAKLVLFACSRKIEQIRVSGEALEAAKQFLTKALEEYELGEAPLIHRGSLPSILRISIGFAIATFSVWEDNETVIVQEKHVKMAERLLTELYERWGLKEYIDFLGAKAITDEELAELSAWLVGKEVADRVLRELSAHSWQGKELASRVGADYGTIRNVMTELKSRELVIKRTLGYQLGRKGAALLRFLLKKSISEQIETALKILRDMITELNGDSPSTADFEKRLAANNVENPQNIAKLLLKDGQIYEPKSGYVRLSKF